MPLNFRTCTTTGTCLYFDVKTRVSCVLWSVLPLYSVGGFSHVCGSTRESPRKKGAFVYKACARKQLREWPIFLIVVISPIVELHHIKISFISTDENIVLYRCENGWVLPTARPELTLFFMRLLSHAQRAHSTESGKCLAHLISQKVLDGFSFLYGVRHLLLSFYELFSVYRH